jgi:hypothetical protein
MGSGYCCETDPVTTTDGSSPRTKEEFVCRHDKPPNSGIRRAEASAGQKFDLEWDMMADHVGDCSVYLTYDVDAPRRQQRYVKIANLPDCRGQNKRRVSIDIPGGLPAGPATLRWDWVAIHLWPSVEWYAQCVDIEVRSSSGVDPSALNGFSIVDPPIYPASGNDGVGFRDPYSGNGYSNQGTGYMTGPACFDEALNACDLTKAGAQGYTGVGGGGAGGAPAPLPPPGASPAPAPAQLFPGGCGRAKYAQCGGQGFSGDACCPAGMWCMRTNQWWSQCEPCGETWNAACEGGGSPALAEVRPHRFLKPGRHAIGGTAWVQRGATAGNHVHAAAAATAQE